jgi:chromosome segregation ATPase
MYPYSLREEREPRKDMLEIAAAVTATAILFACALSDLPRLTHTLRDSQAQEREQNRQFMGQLQTRNNAVEAELAKVTQLLESTRSELAALTKGHGTLGTQVTTATARLRQLESTVQQTSERVAKFGDPGALQQIAKQRDEAMAQSKQSEDQIRQLTLKLQKAGVYP